MKTIFMKHNILQLIRSKTLHVIGIICIVLPISAQTEPAENFAQFLYPNFSKSTVKLKTGEKIDLFEVGQPK